MALSRDVVIRLLGDAKSAVDAQKAAADAAEVTVQQYRKAEREHARVQQAMETAARKQRAAMEDVGRGSMIAGATIVAGLGLAVNAAIKWESAWTGVLKTVNGSPAQLAKVEAGLRGLTSVLPATHEEIAGVAEAAGQLGVKTGDIVKFTKTMIDLGETTNLTSDQAATGLAQLMNVMQTAPEDVGRLGSALVALGNAGASTEADILNMASYITGSAKLIGASESDVLALANAMTSMGINAERGGGVMTRVMQDVYAAVQSGGDQLDKFAEVAGISSAEFARQFRADPIKAIDSFVQGLNGVEESGGNVIDTLSGLGYVGTADTAVLLQLKGAGDLLTDSLDLGSKAWEQNTALAVEAAKRYDTTAAKTEMARNAINDAAIEIGDVFLPVMASLAESVADVAKWFADLPAPIQGAISGLAGVAGVGALVGGAFLLIAPRVMATYKAFQTLNATMPNLSANMGKLGKAAGVAAGLAILGTAVGALDDAMSPTAGTMEQYTAALLDMDGSVDSLNTRFGSLDGGLTTEIDGFADAIKRLTDPSNGERLNDFGGALFNVVTFGGAGTGEGAASRRRVLEEVNGLDQALAFMVQNGNAEMAASQFDIMATEAKKNGVSLAELKELFPGYESALQGVANDQEAAAASAETQAKQAAVLAQNLDFAYGSLQGYAAALGLSEDATKDLITKSSELGESLGAFIDPLGTYTGLLQQKAQAEADAANATAEKTGAASKSWEDFADSVHVTFDEYMADLMAQVTAQQDWQTNMLLLAGRVSAGTLAELSRMGPEGAPLVADLVHRSDAELDAMDDVFAKRSKEATDAWGAQLTLAQPVLAAIAAKGGQGAAEAAARELQAGTKTLAQIASDWGVSIAGGLNPVLDALGKPRIRPTNNGATQRDFWDGGFTGPGGKYEPAGVVHRGEYVLTKQQTSRLGIDRIEAFANGYASGGFVTGADVPRPASTAPFRHPLSTVADAAMQKVYDDTVAWVNASIAPPAFSGTAAGGVQRWLPLVLQALGMVGQPASLAQTVLRRMNQESGGNPMAINNWDVNAKRGTPSKGLMQTIDPTFRAYAMPGYGSNVYDPLSNILASMRYAIARYGSLSAAYNKAGGYELGTDYVPATGSYVLHKGEAVVPAAVNSGWTGRSMAVGGSAQPVEVTVYAQFGDETIEARATRVVVGALTTATNRGGYNG